MQKNVETPTIAEIEAAKEKSKKLRASGNKFYEKKEFEKALNDYNSSILSAPIDESGTGREVALGLANRSALHFERGLHFQALDDIEAAFLFGYPNELR